MTNWALRLRVRTGKGGLATGLRLGRAQAGALVWLGPALAVGLNLMWMTRLRVALPAGGISADITLRLGVGRGLVLALVLFLAAAFFGHLVADAIACSNSVGPAC